MLEEEEYIVDVSIPTSSSLHHFLSHLFYTLTGDWIILHIESEQVRSELDRLVISYVV